MYIYINIIPTEGLFILCKYNNIYYCIYRYVKNILCEYA